MSKYFINRNFFLLLWGMFISQIGDKFYMLALSYWVLEETESTSLMGLVMFCSLIPAIFLGFFIGVFVDRFDRRKLLITADILRGLIVGIVSILYCYNQLNLPVIILSQVLLSVCSAFFDPAIQAMIPQVVKKDELVRANSLSSLVAGVTLIIGPVLGGLSVAFIGYTFVFVLNAITFLISATFTGFVRYTKTKLNKESELNYLHSIREGYQYILQRRRVMIIIIIVAMVHFFVGSVQVLIPFLGNKIPGDGARNLGYLQTFFGLGIVLSSLLLSLRKMKNREEKNMFSGLAGIGLIYIICGFVMKFWVGGLLPYLMIFMSFSFIIIIISTNYQTLIQKGIPSELTGRVFSVMNSLGDSSIPLAMLIFGILLDYIREYILVTFYGIIILLFGIILVRMFNKEKGIGNEN